MPRKKKEENEELVATEAAEAEAEATEAPETVEAAPETVEAEAAAPEAVEAEAAAPEAVEAEAAAPEVVEAEAAAPEAVEAEAAAPEAVEAPKKTVAKAKAKPAAVIVETVAVEKKSKRAERVGVVASDKMTKTVVVRVDRLIKHPIYRKYVKRRKNFMAHDELGSAIGDKVRIIETRPLSARKRWRVVEIIQKAEK